MATPRNFNGNEGKNYSDIGISIIHVVEISEMQQFVYSLLIPKKVQW